MNWLLILVWIVGNMQGQASETRLRVQVYTAEGRPAVGMQVTLDLYRFKHAGGETLAEVWYHERCTTDEQGVCVFPVSKVPPGGGMLYGAVQLGGTSRDVIWPGGDLYLPLRLDTITDGREAEPFEFDTRVPVWVVRGDGRITVVILAALLSIGVYGLYRKAKENG